LVSLGDSSVMVVNAMISRVYGGIRHERVDHDVAVLLNSGVSLDEAVHVWMDSLREAGRIARLSRELVPWQRARGSD
jgi:transposase